MSVSVPVAVPSIPWPTKDPASLVQSAVALKQNVEIAQGTRGTALSSKLHGPTSIEIAINAALKSLP